MPLPPNLLPFLPLIAGLCVLMVGLVFVLPEPQLSEPAARIAGYTRLPGSPGLAVETHTLGQRLIDPALGRLLSLAAVTAPQRVRKSTARELAMAGVSLSPTVYLGIRGILTFGTPALVAFVVLSRGQPSFIGWLIIGFSVLLGRRLSNMWLSGRIKRRQRLIDRALPYALDLMVASLEGGLSLDGSLANVAEQSSGPLAEEIRRTLQEISFGRQASDALRDLADRTGAPNLKRLTDNIIQAERMGISLTQTMRTVADDSRTKRRQKAEEMARKAPIKMMPVLIFCILPSVLLILMTPTAIVLMRMFSSLHR